MVVNVLDVGVIHWRLRLRASAWLGRQPSVCCCLECYDEVRSRRGWREGGWGRFAGLHANCELMLIQQKPVLPLFSGRPTNIAPT